VTSNMNWLQVLSTSYSILNKASGTYGLVPNWVNSSGAGVAGPGNDANGVYFGYDELDDLHVSLTAEISSGKLSIPVVIAGSALFLAIIERFPIVIWGGGALLGWIAGGLLPDDPMVAQYLSEATADKVEILCGISGAILVVAVGWYLVRSTRLREEEADV